MLVSFDVDALCACKILQVRQNKIKWEFDDYFGIIFHSSPYKHTL